MLEELKKLIDETEVSRQTKRYDWATVTEKLRQMKVFKVSHVMRLSGIRRFQQARQWVENNVKIEVSDRGKRVVNEKGIFVKYKAANGSVWYTFEEYIRGNV